MTQQITPEANYCAVIVTALPVEYHAVRAYLANLSEVEHPEGDVYERGLFYAAERLWEVGIVEMGMGNPNAAQRTERAIAHFHPEAVLFVGVAGGIKDVTIGDVVVATKVYGYHAGKADDEFKTRPEVGLPQYRILERARAESRKSDWMKPLDPAPNPVPRVFLGAIAAGEQVVTSTKSDSYKLIRNAYNDALAVEMESYGFLKAAQAHSGLEALAVRGISDLLEGKAEADKSGSQERASRHAAAFAFEVLAKLILPDKNSRPEIIKVIREVPAIGSGSDKTPSSAFPDYSWPKKPTDLCWPMADHSGIREAFATLLTRTSPWRFLPVRGHSETGKSHITRQMLANALCLPALACGRFDFKGGTDMYAEVRAFIQELDVPPPPKSRPLVEQLRLILDALLARKHPVLLIFDTYEAAGKFEQDWVEKELLTKLVRAPWLRVIIAGQRVPERAHAVWESVAHTTIDVVTPPPADWYNYGKQHNPDLKLNEVETVWRLARNRASLLEQLLGPED